MPRPCCKRSRCGTTFQCINGEMENGYCSQHVLGYLWATSGHLRIVYEGWAGSSENTMNRHSIDDPTQVGCAKQRPTVLVGTVCDYLDSFTLPVNPVSFFLFSPLFLLETVGNLLKHCPIRPSNFSIPCWKQLTW